MNQLAVLDNFEEDEPYRETVEKPEWVLQKLKPKHFQICALLAQGFKNVEVSAMCGVTPQYITMLLQQPLIKQEIAKRGEVIGQRFELLTEKTFDVMVDAMKNGAHADKLKAARLQLEVTRRIGRPDPFAANPNVSDDRLEKLANKLENLLDTKKGGLYDEAGNPIFEEAVIVRERIDSGSTPSEV